MTTKKVPANSRGLSPSRRPASAGRRGSTGKNWQSDAGKSTFDDDLSVSGLSVSSLVKGNIVPSRATPDGSSSKLRQSRPSSASRALSASRVAVASRAPLPKASDVPSISASRASPKVAKQGRAKPAWLAQRDQLDDDTPRSELSVQDAQAPFKPSLDDFLDFSVDTRTSSRQTSAVEDEAPPRHAATSQSHDDDIDRFMKSMDTVSPESTKIGKRPSAKSTVSHDSTYGRLPDSDKVKRQSNKPSLSDAVSKPTNTDQSFSHNDNIDDYSDHNTIESSGAPSRESRVSGILDTGQHGHLVIKTSILKGGEKQTPTAVLQSDDMVSLLLRKERAAIIIQKWYRRASLRNKAGHAAMKRIFDNKKVEVEDRLNKEKRTEKSRVDGETLILQRREEKARQARQEAILQMRKSREEKTHSAKENPKADMKFLQASGKASLKPKSKNAKKLTIAAVTEQDADATRCRPATASSVGRKVDAIFEAGTSSAASSHQDATSECSQAVSDVTITKPESTTFDDLMNSLKDLEQPVHDSDRTSITRAWAQSSAREMQSHTGLLSTEIQLDDNRAPGALLSVDKLRSIMDFLDEVEEADKDAYSEISQAPNVAYKEMPSASQLSAAEKDISVHDSASQVASEISNAIAAQKMQLGDKQKTVEMLQKALNQQREFTTEHMKGMDKEHKQQMTLQRQEYEATIQRHLSFIDQLIDDKKVLSKRCEELVVKLKEIDQKYTTKIKSLESSHSQELKKQKDVSEAAEKLRREKWIQDKTRQIKEMTVKGLEPDIQKLITKHKSEIKKLKAMQQGELLEADERAGRRYVQQIEELRRQLEDERDSLVQKERDNCKMRFEKQLEQEEASFQQQRRRLYDEVQEEKERIAQQGQKSRQEILQEHESFEQTHQHTLLSMQEEHTKSTEERERKHAVELKDLQERLDIEKQQWIENFMKKQDTQLLSKERELKESVREARDKEIEMVIARLERETTQAREECERAADNRIKRVRDKYENEIKDLEKSEQSLQQKNSEMKIKISDIENEVIRFRSESKQKDQEVRDVKKMTEQLQMERGKVTDIVRQEFADRLVATDDDNKRLRTEMSEMKARHRIEMERVSHDKQLEMEEVHKRVKQAVSKKESTMQLMRNQLQAAEKRAEHLEMLLADQRKKLLS